MRVVKEGGEHGEEGGCAWSLGKIDVDFVYRKMNDELKESIVTR